MARTSGSVHRMSRSLAQNRVEIIYLRASGATLPQHPLSTGACRIHVSGRSDIAFADSGSLSALSQHGPFKAYDIAFRGFGPASRHG